MSDEFEKTSLAHALTAANGSVNAPLCCGVRMLDDGGCYEGCCDDFKCSECGRRQRVEWPD